jgi:hypothetical protein
MSPTTIDLKRKKKFSNPKRENSFPWLGLVLVVLGLGLVFYFIDTPDINKIDKADKPKASGFLAGATGSYKNDFTK